MVKLSLYSPRGNANSRFFPYTGYLGLTPVRVEGAVRTKLDNDGKPLLASRITVSVKCIESRLGRFGSTHSNVLADYPETLWSKPATAQWGEVGDLELQFKITVPVKTPGFSYVNFQDYRVFWRVEAVIEHTPILGVGSRQTKSYEMPLMRHDTTIPRRPTEYHSRMLKTNKPRAPVVRYHFAVPTSNVGPLDIVTIPLTLHPVDPSVTVRGASLIVERRIELHETSAVPSPSSRQGSASPLSSLDVNDSSSTIRGPVSSNTGFGHPSYSYLPQNGHMSPSAATSTTTLASTFSADTYSSSSDRRPLLQPIVTNIPAKTVSYNVAGVDSSGPFARDSAGVYSKTLTFQWPAAKSNSHWAMGETMQTELINVRFFIHIKVIISSPSSGAETVDLEEREVYLISTNESERKLALGKYNEFRERSKSKSPRRRRDLLPSPQSASEPVPTLPMLPQSSYPLDHTLPLTRVSTSSASSTSTLRRPHTSAGPRDRSNSRPHQRLHHEQEHDHMRFHATKEPPVNFSGRSRPGTAMPISISLKSDAHAKPLGRVAGVDAATRTYAGELASDPGTVRAWEEELERIELESRRSSADMLGFKRKRATSRPNTGNTSSTSSSSRGSP